MSNSRRRRRLRRARRSAPVITGAVVGAGLITLQVWVFSGQQSTNRVLAEPQRPTPTPASRPEAPIQSAHAAQAAWTEIPDTATIRNLVEEAVRRRLPKQAQANFAWSWRISRVTGAWIVSSHADVTTRGVEARRHFVATVKSIDGGLEVADLELLSPPEEDR